MAVTYMKKLEQEPKSYDSKFTSLTKGVNQKIRELILEKVNSQKNILEVGCGTGSLAAEMALKGNKIVAIDKNPKMIEFAKKKYSTNINTELLYQLGDVKELPVSEDSQDVIISTFLLSELRPLEQQIFLRNAWRALKPSGKIIIAAEFEPSGFWKLIFKLKRWWYKKKLRKLKLRETQVVDSFLNYLEPIGFKKKEEYQWEHGMIKMFIIEKCEKENNKPGYYRPAPVDFKGLKATLRILRCVLTGQVDSVPIEPGIYKSGNPNQDSPIIVTSNYVYTYIKVMRDLNDIDAWVLCADSRGINVWCAARGDDFGNKQLIEIVEATDIENLTNKKRLFLPQLSAGGVSAPKLYKYNPNFPFKIIYGPIWSKYLPQYLQELPSKKSDDMKIAKFTLTHRIRAGVTHTTFLLRKIFLWALLVISIPLMVLKGLNGVYMVLASILGIIFANMMIALLYPITNFTRKFIYKGILFGAINMISLGIGLYLISQSIVFSLLNVAFLFWLGFFSTMSFSGYTMATSPREIDQEYPKFRILNSILLLSGIIFSTVSLFFI
ncbi:MAG: conserved membrane protein of unknown function [Promethearchaeota archaeon]|nr:MAG: conserved membrane protein of unknown function [Candidatus Lokiarchaeota archaeon]